MVPVKRTITGSNSSGTMTLGDLRQFVASLDGMPDEAAVRARTSTRKLLRSVTVEEDDIGFREYIKAVGTDAAEPATSSKPRQVRGGREAKPAKQPTSA
jgi:hypothetical protein